MSQRKLSRYERAKSESLEGRTTVGSLKNEFRNKFFNRLRSVRSKSLDRFRQICENYDKEEYTSMMDIRKMLSSDPEASALLITDEVADVIRQIEEELRLIELQEEAESHVREMESETSSIISHFSEHCIICNTLIISSNICDNCKSDFQSNDFSVD